MGVAWRGAIEFAGFPVNVALHQRVKKQRNESFKTIAPSGAVMQQGRPIDSGTGKEYDASESRKGVEGKVKGAYCIIPAPVVEQITEGQKTTVAEPAMFAPLDSIAMDLAIDRFAVLPDEKVPGAEKSTNIVWNGLRKSGMAYLSQVTMRAGGMDGVLAIYADDRGLWAAMLPFESELYSVPTHTFTEDERAAALFEQVVGQQYEVGEFDHSRFVSEYKTRRMRLIAAVIEGKEVDVPKPQEKAPAPDLMALLEAATAQPVAVAA